MQIENGTTSFAVYEDATEYYGLAEVALPELSQLTAEVKGAGISGAFNGVFIGQFEPMSLTLNFPAINRNTIKLAEPRNHHLDLRGVQQKWDNTTGKYTQEAIKHVIVAHPVKFNPGKLAPASPTETSGEYSVSYYATYINGKKVLEVDILNFIFFIDGVDYLADVRKALGKA